MWKRPPNKQDIDRFIEDAQNGSPVRYPPLYSDYVKKLRQFAADNSAFDPEDLRLEGYAIIDAANEVRRSLGVREV